MRHLFCALVALLLFSWSAVAQEKSCDNRDLRVGYHQFPGVIEQDGAGGYIGLAQEILRTYAKEQSVTLCMREYPDFKTVFPSVERGEVDLMVGAFTITEAREEKVDFTVPYMNAGVGILVPVSNGTGIGTVMGAIFDPVTLKMLGLYLLFLFGGALLLWCAERGNNEGIPDKFKEGYIQAVYCAFDISTTIGFGRVEPRRVLGRLIALPVFIAGAIFVGTLIGQVSSALTVAELGNAIASVDALRGKKVATKAGTSNVPLLKKARAKIVEVSSREETVELLRKGEVDAVVYDAPYLKRVAVEDPTFTVSAVFAPQHYGFAVPEGSGLREKLNLHMLNMWGNGTLAGYTKQYFGSE